MKILYVNASPPSIIPGTEAVANEISLLQREFQGEYIDIYPFRRPRSWLPPALVGLQRLRYLKKMDESVDLHHIFSPVLYPYPFLRLLRKPIVYTVSAGIDENQQEEQWRNVHVVVGSRRDRDIARIRGLPWVSCICPGIDVSRFQRTFLPLTDDCVLFSASAPWTREQFTEKGFDLLFDVVSRIKNLRLVLLWRGLFTETLYDKIKKYGIEDRVRVINGYADISTILPNVHGAIILASNPHVVRTYPHSMIESLAAGKPVIMSSVIPMADYISRHGCGCIVEGHSVESLECAIRKFVQEYPVINRNAMEIGARDFSRERMIREYHTVYRMVLNCE